MKALRFCLGVLLLLAPEILRVYFIMPFPGSQEDVATGTRQINIAYWLHNNIWWVRLIGLALVLGPLVYYLRNGGWWKRIGAILPVALCALVFYAFNFKFMADKMFYPPEAKVMTSSPGPFSQGEGESLVIEVERNGDARAYPIELIGYHHQVLDTIGGEPVLVTYCTVCRTGRAWKPIVRGQPETFRLVGMDHFNAMFEDSLTKSWWRQATGECIAGPLKGDLLDEVPSQQSTLKEFAARYPKGLVFQPDNHFTEEYAGLKDYDEGTMVSSLEGRDTASWQPKSWVVGVVHNGQARAYDWNDAVERIVIGDTLGGDTIEVLMFEGNQSFGVYKRWWHRDQFNEFVGQPSRPIPKDSAMASHIDSLTVPAFQEFWHSWRTFHPNTTRYTPKK